MKSKENLDCGLSDIYLFTILCDSIISVHVLTNSLHSIHHPAILSHGTVVHLISSSFIQCDTVCKVLM